MERIILERTDIAAARHYVPLKEKLEFVNDCADRCFDRLRISVSASAPSGDRDDKESPADDYPPMYKVNAGLKARYLMGALAQLYLRHPAAVFEDAGTLLLTEASYDIFAGSHVLNQIQRFKSDPTVRDLCFNLISDYDELRKMLSVEINALLAVQNDPVVRQSMLMQSEVAALPGVIEQFQKLQERRRGDDRK